MLRNNGILHAAAAALFLAAAAPANAENWQAFGADEDGTTAFLDVDSIVASGNVRTFSMKYVVPGVPNVSYTVIPPAGRLHRAHRGPAAHDGLWHQGRSDSRSGH